MSVILETSKGDIVVDLFVNDCPKACNNFLKLCKVKAYNNCVFYNVQRNFIVQTGDPTNSGRGGQSINGILYGEQARFFDDEIRPHLKHTKKGVVGMASAGPDLNASQFYITTGDDLHSLDEKHTIFGEVAEGWDVLEAINETPCDDAGRPLQNIRIRHTIVLDDPFPDPPSLENHIPDASPPPQFADDGRLEDDWVPDDETRPSNEIEASNREKEAHNRAVVLEMIGDLPEADAAPPPNMLFICKLNPVTTEEDLEIIFSRFGTVTACDIIRDWKTGDSLCYGFIGFDAERSCEDAYFKMNNVLIDDRRIKVDFSQSVHHLWKQFKRFGRRGDAGLGKEAENHQRLGHRNELHLKEHLLPGGVGRGGGYTMVLVGEEDDRRDSSGREERHQRYEREHGASRSAPRTDRNGNVLRRKDERRRGEQEKGRDERRRNTDSRRHRERRDHSREGGREQGRHAPHRQRSRSRSRGRGTYSIDR